jgi:hypothetical protein
LEAENIKVVLGMNSEQFETARELINTTEELTEKQSQILSIVALVQNKREIDELLQANTVEQSKLIERGVEPIEVTISEQIAATKFNLSKLDKAHQEYSEELDKLLTKDKGALSFVGSDEEALSQDQLRALEKENSILYQAQKEATSEYYKKSDEHDSLRESIQQAHLKLREDLRIEELQKKSFANTIDYIYADLRGLEQASATTAQGIKIQTGIIRGLKSKTEVQAEPRIDAPFSMKQQIAHNKEMAALTAAFEARLAKLSQS